MITPIDIQQVGFAVRLRGYDRREVDNFLDGLTHDYEMLIKENQEGKGKTVLLEAQLTDLKKRETLLNRTLMSAQKIVEEVKQNAQRDADLIFKEAELKAEEITKKAHEDRFRLQMDIQGLYKQKALFLEKLRVMLKGFEKAVELEAEEDPIPEGQNGHQGQRSDS